MSLFIRAWLTDSGWRSLVHYKNVNNHFNSVSIFDLRSKAKYLAKSIERAIDHYDKDRVKFCERAIQAMSNFGNSDQLELHDSDNFNQR